MPDVRELLHKQSGLLGVSGISNNMQVLEASDDPQALEAIELYCYRASCEIGALASPLGGLDALVLTAGIGENSARVRQAICERSGWLGVTIDEDANRANALTLNSAASTVEVRVIATDEEAVIARATRQLVKTNLESQAGASSRPEEK